MLTGLIKKIKQTPEKHHDCDSVSSGERKRNSLNHPDLSGRGCGTSMWEIASEHNGVEKPAKDRESRVCEASSPLEASQVMRCT